MPAILDFGSRHIGAFVSPAQLPDRSDSIRIGLESDSFTVFTIAGPRAQRRLPRSVNQGDRMIVCGAQHNRSVPRGAESTRRSEDASAGEAEGRGELGENSKHCVSHE